MILSVSRRTDIPAFYSSWFFNRLKEGWLYVRNPLNIHHASKIALTPDVIDGIVFWSKNPAIMIKRLSELEGYNYYFQFTLNAYGQDIEPEVPEQEKRINIFKALSRRTGRKKVVWRYDPIFFTDTYTLDFHAEQFRNLAETLHEYTDTCTISFLDRYRNIKARLNGAGIHDDDTEKQRELAGKFADIAGRYGLRLETCAESIDLSEFGITRAHCIDKIRLEEIGGFRLNVGKDRNQREECGCCESIDVGEYDTCKHECIYCYARRRKKEREGGNDENSPFLWGNVREGDIIRERVIKSFRRAH